MPYNEDAQPNEVRHARKGNTAVPTIRSTSQPRAGHHRGRGYSLRGNNRGRGRHGPTRGSAHGTAGPRDVVRDYPPHETPGRWVNSQSGGHRSRRPSKKPKLEDARYKRGDVVRSFAGCSGVPHSRTTTIDDPGQASSSTSQAHLPSKAPPLSGNNTSLDLRQQDSRMPFWESPKPSRITAPYPSDSDYVHDMGSALSLDSLHLVKVEEGDNVTPPPLPLQTTSAPRTLFLGSTSNLPSIDRHIQQTEMSLSEPSESVTSSPVQESASTHVHKRIPRFRSGRLRFELPKRRQVDIEAGVTSDARLYATPQTLSTERHSSNPEFPDIWDLLCDSAMEDAQSISHDPEESLAADSDVVEVVQMRVEPHDKPRRLIVLPSHGVLSVTMRGSFDLVEQGSLRRTALRTASVDEESRQLVDDACLLRHPRGDFFALGRASNTQQLSVVRFQGKVLTDIGIFDRPTQPGKKHGISAMCSMSQPGTFVTGGYDHIVHRWSFSEEYVATPTPLAIRHTSTLQSLLQVRDTGDKLLSGSADCSLSVYDLSAERVVNLLKLSNSVYQVHAAPSRFCALLEVGHKELQFEIRDFRVVSTAPVIRFGYPNMKVHGRYTRGAVRNQMFACGGSDKDGCVRLWDLRKPTEVLRSIQCFPGRKATQVVFDEAWMITSSDDHQLAFIPHVSS